MTEKTGQPEPCPYCRLGVPDPDWWEGKHPDFFYKPTQTVEEQFRV